MLRLRAAALPIVLVLAAVSCAVDPDRTVRGGGPPQGTTDAGAVAGLPSSFRWTSTGPLVSPIPDATHPILSVKDPSVVFFNDRWHVFATTANTAGSWSMIYLTFADWAEAAAAQPYYLDNNPNLRGYHAAPQVFYFAPQAKWYLIFQSGQPQYSTTDDISKPESWTTPVNFFVGEPPGVTANKGVGFWLDFWVICDAAFCHLFFTDDDGELFRSQTAIGSFPMGFGDAVVAIQGVKETVFEGSSTYRVKGTAGYLTLVEAFGPTGNRFYRSFVASSLDGAWTPLADSWTNPFAGKNNVTFADGVAWTNDISHGEMIRAGHDQHLEIDPTNLRYLYQGVDPALANNPDYFRLPYRLGLLTEVR
jgi:hypothetical protein